MLKQLLVITTILFSTIWVSRSHASDTNTNNIEIPISQDKQAKLIAIVDRFESYCTPCHTGVGKWVGLPDFMSARGFSIQNPEHTKTYDWVFDSEELDQYMQTLKPKKLKFDQEDFFKAQYIALRIIDISSDIEQSMDWLGDSPEKGQMPPKYWYKSWLLKSKPEEHKIMLQFLSDNFFVPEVN